MLHYARKVAMLGLYRASRVCLQRAKQPFYDYYLRKKYRLKNDNSYHSSKNLFESDRLKYFSQLLSESSQENQQLTQEKAQSYCAGIFSIFGVSFTREKENFWHRDMRCDGEQGLFDAHSFYRDIVLTVPESNQEIKDIKFSWELSRFNHAVLVAHAYRDTGDVRFAKFSMESIGDWIIRNPYLHGVGWFNALEVSLRVINWITALSLISQIVCTDTALSNTIISSLRDHQEYIRCNKEFYDGRTNNHYYANLVGSLYCAFFFEEEESVEKIFHELMAENAWQIDSDGACYEGSTRYHVFVSELAASVVPIALLFDKSKRTSYADYFNNICTRMNKFTVWCTPIDGSLAIIGDDDGAYMLQGQCLLRSLHYSAATTECTQSTLAVKHYKSFGLSIIKSNHVHCTLRHHAYRQQQPTAHFHSDILSITLTWKGVTIFTDPGTYTYTGSRIWRNYFRHNQQHSSFAIADCDPLIFTDNIFYCPLPAQQASCNTVCQADTITVVSYHDLYRDKGLRAWRSLAITEEAAGKKAFCTIVDWWEPLVTLSCAATHVMTSWSFIAGASCCFAKQDDRTMIYQGTTIIGDIVSDLDFDHEQAFVSPTYGVKVRSCALRAKKNIALSVQQKTSITLY